MNRLTFLRSFPLFLLFCLPLVLAAQVTLSEQPRSADLKVKRFLAERPLPQKKLPVLDPVQLEREDRNFPGERFAAPLGVNLGLNNSGQWITLPNGDRIWRLHLEVSGAKGLALLYDRFYLPAGARLHVYRPDRRQVLGAYTQQNNSANGRFLAGFIQGPELVVEYFEPAEVAGQGQLHIFRVDQVYKEGMFSESALRSGQANELGFGTSFACHTNINCPEGQAYQTEKNGVVRILVVVEEGSGFCTGSLLNNTRHDGTPYVLSAFHCQDGFTPLFDFWRFDFGFEAANCLDPGAEPSRNSVLGCTLRAGRQENDFILLELANAVPASFQPYFLGWDRAGAAPDSGAIIHHPRGDLKKIAFENTSIRVFTNRINWNNEVTTPPDHHFILHYDFGAFEIGSSGSALLNPERQVVGQLHGGSSTCDSTKAYFGRFHLSWEGGGTPATRLKDWLDPDNTGAMEINGMAPDYSTGHSVGGMVNNEMGDPISGAQVSIVGDEGTSLSTVTDAQGLYAFDNLPAGDNYELSISKAGDVLNGVSTLDLIRVQKHILNLDALESAYRMLAADVNNSGSITTLDLIIIRKVILGIEPDFSPLPNWLFLPVDAQYQNPANPFEGLIGNPFRINNLQEDRLAFDFIGFKPGDVNGSAETGN